MNLRKKGIDPIQVIKYRKTHCDGSMARAYQKTFVPGPVDENRTTEDSQSKQHAEGHESHLSLQ
jgi:hypothetical protein